MRLSIFLGALLIGISGVAAVELTGNYNPTGEGCVDAKGYLSCYQAQITRANGCFKACNQTNPEMKGTAYDNCLLGCNGAWLAGNIGCWIQSCWNQVYSCAYQLTAISYFAGNDIVLNANVPFFPPPSTATGGACVCNLGYVYGNETKITDYGICLNIASSGTREQLADCECCAFSAAISNIMNTCPNNDLSILQFPQRIVSTQNLLTKTTNKCAIIDNNNAASCVSDYGQPWAGPKGYNPLNLPAGQPGTLALSNSAGNAFTKFDVASYTLQLFPGFSSVITAAPFVATAGAATNTGSRATSGAGSSATTTGAGAGSAAGAAATTTKASAGSIIVGNGALMWGCFISFALNIAI